MTISEAKKVYEKLGEGTSWYDRSQWRAIAIDIESCRNAKSLKLAVQILTKEKYGDPLFCAKIFRGECKVCPHCGGAL